MGGFCLTDVWLGDEDEDAFLTKELALIRCRLRGRENRLKYERTGVSESGGCFMSLAMSIREVRRDHLSLGLYISSAEPIR
jgi:hypothetical protein